MAVIFKTECEILEDIGSRARSIRLSQNLTQEFLSKKSGVSLGSIKRFEKSGEISLKSLYKIALVLGHVQFFESVFHEEKEFRSLDEIKKLTHSRKRGRKNA